LLASRRSFWRGIPGQTDKGEKKGKEKGGKGEGGEKKADSSIVYCINEPPMNEPEGGKKKGKREGRGEEGERMPFFLSAS